MNTLRQLFPLNILLADDDSDDRYFFNKALNEIPISTKLDTVYDGERLMAHLANNLFSLPDVLFLDLSMPRKSGFECLTEIKENRQFDLMPVIMFSTSYTRDVNYEQSVVNILQKIGAHDYIRKPNDFEQLKLVIQNVLVKILKAIPAKHALIA